MLHPFLENTTKTVQYILLWFTYAILQTFVLVSLVALPLWIIIVDGLVHATLFGVLGLFLWSVIKYGNYSILTVFQRSINYVAIGILTLGIWIGSGYGFFYLCFGMQVSDQLIQLLPTRGFIGLLIYLLIVQQFRFALVTPVHENNGIDTTDTAEVNENNKNQQLDVLERIAVKSGSKIHVVLVSEILFIQADGDYVMIYTTNGKYLKEQTMKYFEEHLPQQLFVRVHRSAIVNVEMISRIELYEKQNQILTLKNGQQIKTSPAGYKSLKMTLKL